MNFKIFEDVIMITNFNMNKITAEDIEKANVLLSEISEKSDELCTDIDNLTQKVQDEEMKTEKGLSFLEIKYHLLLSYVNNLVFIVNQKVNGKSILTDNAVDRLLEIRIVLEKMKPIDKKLKYQIDKLIKITKTGSDLKDATELKPNLENYESSDDEESSEEVFNGNKKEKNEIYRPPKLAPVPYEEEESSKIAKDKKEAERRKRALTSSLYKDLQRELHDGPEEIHESLDLHRAKIDKKSKERQEYEEKYFMRMSVPKKEQNELKRMRTLHDIDSITSFGHITGLTHEYDDDEETGNIKKKQKKNSRKFKGKGKKKKKFKH